MNFIYKHLRFLGHKVLSGKIRHNLYLIPYFFHINWFMNKVNPDEIELFKYIEIETINRCNGDCAFCPVNINQPQRPFAQMKDELFKKIIDELGELKYSGEIHLFSNNEPFLDKRIYQFADYARRVTPAAYITIYTNGTLLTLEGIKDIVRNVDLIVIDNYKDDTLNNNLNAIKKWCETKEKGTEKVCIDKRDYAEILSSRGGTAPNKPRGSMFGVSRGCIYPYRQMVIRPDGKCSLCCNDALGKYTLGDISEMRLVDVWYSKEYFHVRQSIKRNGRKGLELCKNCDTHYFDKT